MKELNYKKLEGKTIGDLNKMEGSVKNLPTGFKMKVPKQKIKSAQELIDELK